MFQIFTAYPRGYCAWVHRAVDMLMQVTRTYPSEKIYVNHEIIHNTFVIKMFERRGVVFQSDLSKIPERSLVVISAHGTGPTYFAALRARNIRWIDATCPLVEKVHREARDYIAKGYHILYIGKKWHQEAVGVIDEGERHFTLIERVEDVEKLIIENWKLIMENGKLALLTQTTLSVDDTATLIAQIQEWFPHIILPKAGDICYATTNRQKAVKVLAKECDTIFVVGSKSSSNSGKLRDVAESLGKRAYLIEDASEIDPEWLRDVDTVWVTAGASGPEELVEWVVEYLQTVGGIFDSELRVVEEKVEFPYTLKIMA